MEVVAINKSFESFTALWVNLRLRCEAGFQIPSISDADTDVSGPLFSHHPGHTGVESTGHKHMVSD